MYLKVSENNAHYIPRLILGLLFCSILLVIHVSGYQVTASPNPVTLTVGSTCSTTANSPVISDAIISGDKNVIKKIPAIMVIPIKKEETIVNGSHGHPHHRIGNVQIVKKALFGTPEDVALLSNEANNLPTIEILDRNDTVLLIKKYTYQSLITVPMQFPGDINDQVPSVISTNPETNIIIPYVEGARKIRITDEYGQVQDVITLADSQIRDHGTITLDQLTSPPPSNPATFNVLILASGYSPTTISNFNTKAILVKQQILNSAPFISHSPETVVNIYPDTLDLGCYSGCYGIDRLMCCDGSKVMSAAADSGSFFDEIIVIHNTATYSGGGYREGGTKAYQTDSYSTYCEVYDGQYTVPMALHEFGHSFGDLCDEYTYGSEGYSYYPCVNCRAGCSDWSSFSGICTLGCDARNDFFRPEQSIMFDLSSSTIYNQPSIKAVYSPDGLEKRLDFFLRIPVTASFNGTPLAGTVPLDVKFTDSSTGTSITSYQWDFGDGNITSYATKTNPVHRYTVADTYSVNLTVTNAGGSNSLLRTNYITVTASPDANPQWQITPVDSAGYVGSYTSLALDGSDNPRICYFDGTNQDLKYVKWMGSIWENSIVDESGGWYTSLTLDGLGNPHISYYDYSNGDLKYAKWTGSKWEDITVDSVGDVGWYTSLALDGAGNPCISYFDATNRDLKYANWTGSGWENITIDSAGDVGIDTSLMLDGSGNPRISYYDATNRDLKYAKWTGSLWEKNTVDSIGDVGGHSSLALDGSGNPRISYYDATNRDLKYAKWTGSLWEKNTVDSAGDVGWFTSLALDGAGNPRISYYIQSFNNLKYAKWTGSKWENSTVDSFGVVGSFNSLALDRHGNPRISYFDETNENLKYAKFVPAETRIGIFRNSTHIFYLDYNGNGVWNGAVTDTQYNFGITGDIPITGDWNLDGRTEIGVFRNSTHLFYLDYNGNGVWNGASVDRQYNFGLTGDKPVAGDWNLDGRTEIGVFRPSTHIFYLDYNGNGVWNGASVDRQYNFGITGDIPITGDWNSDGKTEIGVFRNSTHLFYLDYNGNGVWNGASIDKQYNFGLSGDIPVSGDWNLDGRTEIGAFRSLTHLFYLDYNGNGVWNGGSIDKQYNFGITGDQPISGKWT